jgi:hypothetical protein
MVSTAENPSVVSQRIGNVSAEADAAFMAELKRIDRPRYDHLVDNIRKQAYKTLRTPKPPKSGSVTC